MSGSQTPTGQTRLAGVIGWPVRHSASPAIHNAAFAHLGLDWAYLAFPVPPGRVAEAVAGMEALGIEGLSVTMPHKTAVAAVLDHLTDDAAALGAVNCVYRDDGRFVGHNTDGAGFVDSLGTDEGIEVSGMVAVVVGAGGAARAVVRGLHRAGTARVGVLNRTPERAEVAAALAGTKGAVAAQSDLAGADLVVNATPVGMGDDTGVPFDVDTLAGDAIVVDLVYHPETTPLLAAATDSGRRAVGGIGMLVHQAAHAFTAWTGVNAPVDAMAAAARSRDS